MLAVLRRGHRLECNDGNVDVSRGISSSTLKYTGLKLSDCGTLGRKRQRIITGEGGLLVLGVTGDKRHRRAPMLIWPPMVGRLV
ncbi:hypothetical protein XFHB_13425 [Xylella fastidiosa]|uniref:Uncharacterized protein n=1 Tax=Xylella fastidiosa TaxID=2371 RepID=A0ABD7BXR1_XYLFS|nr:hypothetical protein [Xylella fastidiosa]QPB72659.1 hypothetical protein XFHB_13425 [Xylella fastidiosa]